MKRLMMCWALACVFPVLGFSAKPVTLKPELILDHIETITPQEHRGDELYLSISASKKDSPTEYIRIPNHPIHWTSNKVSNLSKVPMWSQEIAPGTSVVVVTSLVDEDMPYWNIDDIIGSVRLRIKNENGVLMTSWDMPNQVKEVNTKSHPEVLEKNTNAIKKFDLIGDGAHYVLYLSLSSSSQIRK